MLSSTDTFEDLASGVTHDDLSTHQRQIERTKSIEALSIKSEPLDNEENQKRRVIPTTPPVQPSTPSSSSISTTPFLISPPANTQQHKTKTPLSTNTISNPPFPAMMNNSNNTFAPRISSTVAQKNTWPPPLHMTSSTRQPPNVAQKRPALPTFSLTAQRNSNTNPPTMRMPPTTPLQPQSFDAFSMNVAIARRPNGVSPVPNPPPIPPRNPIRVSLLTRFLYKYILTSNRCYHF